MHYFAELRISKSILTRRKVLKVAKIKDANYGCKDEGWWRRDGGEDDSKDVGED